MLRRRFARGSAYVDWRHTACTTAARHWRQGGSATRRRCALERLRRGAARRQHNYHFSECRTGSASLPMTLWPPQMAASTVVHLNCSIADFARGLLATRRRCLGLSERAATSLQDIIQTPRNEATSFHSRRYCTSGRCAHQSRVSDGAPKRDASTKYNRTS